MEDYKTGIIDDLFNELIYEISKSDGNAKNIIRDYLIDAYETGKLSAIQEACDKLDNMLREQYIK